MAAFKLICVILFVSLCSGRYVHHHKFNDDALEYLLRDRQYKEDQGEVLDTPRFAPSDENIPKVGELFEGDMVMDARLRDAVLGNDKRSAYRDENTRWPNGVVPYIFDSEIHPIIKGLILKAVRAYNHYTCIRLIPRTNQTDYVEFTSKINTCSSTVGRAGGKQLVKLGIGCRVLGTVLHEIMHTLGIIHEQSRPDRDNHISVKFDNIKTKLLHNFHKYSFQDVTNLEQPYNFNSVMHYRNNAFTSNGDDTLQALKDPSLRFGQRVMFSRLDVKMINRLYHCKKHESQSSYLVPDMTESKVAAKKRSRSEGHNYDDDDEERRW